MMLWTEFLRYDLDGYQFYWEAGAEEMNSRYIYLHITDIIFREIRKEFQEVFIL